MTISPVDVGFVFALHQESVGIADRLQHSRRTTGNGWKFFTGNIGKQSVALILSGIGQKKAEGAANMLLDVFAPKIICSTGYAGGLSTRLKRGNLCVPEQILRKSDMQALDLSMPIPQKTLFLPNKLTLLTSNDVVDLPARKRALYEQTGCELVDMETFAIAETCRVRHVPFVSYRVIFDAADDQIPKDIAAILDSLGKGVARLSGAVLGSIWSRPSVVCDLVSLKRRAWIASDRLARFTLAKLSRKKSDKQCMLVNTSEP